ncbi:arginine-tRNA-protein transferase [Amylocystis lapponica]|nr:arginine-tRNA-protein transferase [Amylocystis lapponica]
MSPTSIIIPLPAGDAKSRCGYCERNEKKSGLSRYHKAVCQPLRLTCTDYQRMIDRGWRRSGMGCYKPDLKRSCCAQYTIKLDALEFKPSRSQRQLMNRWNRFIIHGDDKGSSTSEDNKSGNGPEKRPPKPNKLPAYDSLASAIHASESDFVTGQEPVHKFSVTLEPASYSDEKFALYESYQSEIHLEENNSPDGFEGFLVESPLTREPLSYASAPPDHLPREYGAYHQMYRLDGELIAMGVIDILPNCVSSVYFMYEKKWERFSMGKLSALRETALAKEIHDAGAEDVQSLYMGFYIHSCQKMRYKGDYHPSYLADPEEYTWFPLETCRPLLDKYRYASFAHPEHCTEEAPPAQDVSEVPLEVLQHVMLLQGLESRRPVITPVIASQDWRKPAVRCTILTLVDALGPQVAQSAVLYLAQ